MRNDDRRKAVERLLLAIAVHGPEAAFAHLDTIRGLYRRDRDAFIEVRAALREAGMEMAEVLDLISGQHPIDCACWRCIMRLHAEVYRDWCRRASEASAVAPVIEAAE